MNDRVLNILLVEDDLAEVGLTVAVLNRARLPYQMQVAADGEEALAVLRRQEPFARASPPDLILLDLNLPKKGGGAVLAEITAEPALQRIPVIIVTGCEERVVRRTGLGAKCFLPKPLDLELFIMVLRSIQTVYARASA